jgi:hypothetical protein
MFIDYTWEDNCGTEAKIECFIGEKRLSIWKTQPWFVKVHYFEVDYCIKTSKEKCVFMLPRKL